MDATYRNDPSPGHAVRDGARETGPALEACYRFLLWRVPALECSPCRQKFLLGDRIQNAALDVLESLVEATYSRRREPLLARANLGIEKLRFLSPARPRRGRGGGVRAWAGWPSAAAVSRT